MVAVGVYKYRKVPSMQLKGLYVRVSGILMHWLLGWVDKCIAGGAYINHIVRDYINTSVYLLYCGCGRCL